MVRDTYATARMSDERRDARESGHTTPSARRASAGAAPPRGRPAPARRALSRRRLTASTREALAAYLFLAPWLVGLLVFTLGPVVVSLVASFTDYAILTPGQTHFVGWANYANAFTQDPLFWHTLRVTLYYSALALPLNLIIGFGLAQLLNTNLPGIAIFRSLYYLPAVISGVVVTLLWLWILNPRFGLVNYLLGLVHVAGPGWMFSADWVIPSFVLISLWGIGRTMLIYLAMLQAIPTPLYEAAEIDGAGSLRRLRYVTLPLVTPAVFFNMVLGLIDSFQFFTTAYVATKGGPADASMFYALYLYLNAFQYFNMGYAAALAWILFAVVAVLTIILFRTGAIWVFYQDQEAGG